MFDNDHGNNTCDPADTRAYKPWSDINIGSESYFKSCSIAGVNLCIAARRNQLVVHHVGESNFNLVDDAFGQGTCESFEVLAVKKGLEVIDAHRKQYIAKAKSLGIDLES